MEKINFKTMIFKNKRVFVQVDEAGNILQKDKKAFMRYNKEDNRVYSPLVSNLKDEGSESCFTQVPIKKKSNQLNLDTSTPALNKNTIYIYTDGGCIGNPGPAGYGFIIQYPDGKVVEKGEPLGQGTNNIAELTAILKALEYLSDFDIPVEVCTDSSYSIGVLTLGWKAKANIELINTLKKRYLRFKNIKIIKVKGHAGDPLNERVDKLANQAARTQKSQP